MGGSLVFFLTSILVFNAGIGYYFMDYGDQKVKDLNRDGVIISAGLTFYLW